MPSLPPDAGTASRRTLFTLITLTIPVLFFLLIEGFLRLIGYGPDLSLFTTVTVRGQAYHVMNPEIRARYFPTTDFRPATSTELFLIPKPAGTFRIFCLGGSTTVGYPYGYNGSFPSFLRERLEATFPDRTIEVINLGMTATNSFTVLDIARELDAADPDLLIVYDGHNEFYGALGVASRESVGRSRWITELYLRAIHSRAFLLVRDLYTKIRGSLNAAPTERDGGTMMERLARGQEVPYRSDLYADGVSAFRANLRDLTDLCVRRHVPLILGTQVSNLKDLPPLSPGGAGDSLDAAIPYREGRTLDSLGDRAGALAAFRRARDYDRLRFRASSDLNRAILDCGTGTAGLVSVADIEAAFIAFSPDSIPGRNLILEHLHPNLRGSFLIAREYALAMRRRGLLAPEAEWRRRDTLSDALLWEARHISPIDERIAARKVQILTAGWPFTDHVPIVPAVAAGDTLGLIAEEVTRGRSDLRQAHKEALAYDLQRLDSASAEQEYRILISLDPTDLPMRLQYAHLLLVRGKTADMRRELTASLSLIPTLLAHRALADLDRQERKYESAIEHYRAVLGFEQTPRERAEHAYLLGLTFAMQGRRDSALVWVTESSRLAPEFAPAQEALRHLMPE